MFVRFYFLKVECPNLSLDIRSLILSIMSYVVYLCTCAMYNNYYTIIVYWKEILLTIIVT